MCVYKLTYMRQSEPGETLNRLDMSIVYKLYNENTAFITQYPNAEYS